MFLLYMSAKSSVVAKDPQRREAFPFLPTDDASSIWTRSSIWKRSYHIDVHRVRWETSHKMNGCDKGGINRFLRGEQVGPDDALSAVLRPRWHFRFRFKRNALIRRVLFSVLRQYVPVWQQVQLVARSFTAVASSVREQNWGRPQDWSEWVIQAPGDSRLVPAQRPIPVTNSHGSYVITVINLLSFNYFFE